MSLLNRITDLKERIEESKLAREREKGKLAGMEETMKKKYKCTSLEELQKQVREMKADNDKREKELKELLGEIEERFDD